MARLGHALCASQRLPLLPEEVSSESAERNKTVSLENRKL